MTEKRFCEVCDGATTDMGWTESIGWLCNACRPEYLRRQAEEVARQMRDEKRLCTICGRAVEGGVTFNGVTTCLDCNARRTFPERYAKADIAAEESTVKVPMNIIAKSRSIDRGTERIADLIGQVEHDAWEAGFEAAVRIVEHEGGTAVAQTLREALADYSETQGVERSEQ